MSIKYPYLGEGLHKMYMSNIGILICTLLMFIPVINILAAIGVIVFSIFYLIGLHTAGTEVDGCRTAFALEIAALIVQAVATLLSVLPVISAVGSIAADVMKMIVSFLVVISLNAVAKEVNAESVIKIGKIVLISLILSTVAIVLYKVSAVVYLFAYREAIFTFYCVCLCIGVALELFFGIMFLVFLRKSSTDL